MQDWKLRDWKLTNWKIRDWTVEGAMIVSKNETFNILHHTNVNEYNICNVYQRLATRNGVQGAMIKVSFLATVIAFFLLSNAAISSLSNPSPSNSSP